MSDIRSPITRLIISYDGALGALLRAQGMNRSHRITITGFEQDYQN